MGMDKTCACPNAEVKLEWPCLHQQHIAGMGRARSAAQPAVKLCTPVRGTV